MARGRGGFIGQDGLNAPDSPTGISATAGNTTVSVAFTAPTDVGGSAITGFNIQTGSGLGLDSMIQEVDLANGSYDSKEYSVARNDISMKADGIKWIGKTLAGVFYSYTMSTPFDITTSSQTSTIDLGSNTGNSAQGLHVKPDGTKFYVIDLTNTRVLQFAMSTAWDVSTASYESKLFGLSSQESSPRDITFSEDGTKMYAVGTGNDSVFQYTLSSAWDVSTASYASKSLDVSSQDTAPIGLDISRNGKNLVVGGAAGNDVNQYNLTTAFDVSTGSYSSTLTTLSNGYFPALAGETDTTTKMYVTTDSVVRQYSVGGSTPTVTSSPFTFTGLSNGTSYTFNVWAINAFGYSAPSDASTGVSPAGSIGVFMGGAGSAGNVASSLNISSLGNSDNTFGTIGTSKEQCSTTGSATHAFRMGGNGPSNEIYRIAYASGGSATDYANLSTATRLHGGFGNSTRGFTLGGYTSSAGVNTILTFLYSSSGDSTDFGDMGSSTYYVTGSSNSTRGVYSRPSSNSRSNVIEYITLGSSGSSADFGDLTSSRFRILCTASATRALFGGGDTSGGDVNTIDYVTIASTGNATDFGDLTVARNRAPAAASTTRGVFCGGYNTSGTGRNTIDYVTFSSTGNAVDFGDMSTNHYESTGGASSISAAVS